MLLYCSVTVLLSYFVTCYSVTMLLYYCVTCYCYLLLCYLLLVTLLLVTLLLVTLLLVTLLLVTLLLVTLLLYYSMKPFRKWETCVIRAHDRACLDVPYMYSITVGFKLQARFRSQKKLEWNFLKNVYILFCVYCFVA